MLGQSQVWASGWDSDDVVGTHRETRWMLAKGTEGLLGVRWKLTIGDRELDRKASGVRYKMTKRLVESSPEVVGKIAGSALDGTTART
ncbi:hypothetical protein GW17_00056482 [Ensete ventricosum]|nr:hypothetical protein GW17_00056482 [Ensete ventricosum]